MNESWRHVVQAQEAGLRLDKVVATVTGWARAKVRRAVAAGAVQVNDRRCLVAAHLVAPDEELRIFPVNPDRDHIDDGKLRLLFEDEALLVVDKPAGLPTQPPPRGGDALSLRVATHLAEAKDAERRRDGQPHVGLIHRLDRDASGLLLFGKRKEATAALSRGLRRHNMRRYYLALVRTAVTVPTQQIEEPLAPNEQGGTRCHASGVPARTTVVQLAFDPVARLALVGLRLHSGRMHQARVHLAWGVGVIVGDGRYGDPLADGSRLALHCAALQLRHPRSGEIMRWQSPPPPDFLAASGSAALPLPEDWLRQIEEAAQ